MERGKGEMVANGISEVKGTMYAVTNEISVCSKRNQVAFQAIKCINYTADASFLCWNGGSGSFSGLTKILLNSSHVGITCATYSEVLGSNLSPHAGNPDCGYLWFSKVLHENIGAVPQVSYD
jgi:hypothetical protein